MQSITLNLPDNLYQRAEQTARALHRPLEEFLLEAVTTALPLLDDLPPDLVNDMAALALLNDEALWHVARATLAAIKQERLDLLLSKNSAGQLTEAERQELDELLQEYERVVLTRAHAAVLLKQRHYDVSDPAVFSPLPETQ